MIPTDFKPMLASALKDGALPAFPCLVSPKLDGVRAFVFDGVVYSRNLKPIPNQHTQTVLGTPSLAGVDGELIVGKPTSATAFRDTMSGVMSEDGTPAVTLWAFDKVLPGVGFQERLRKLKQACAAQKAGVKVVPQLYVENEEELKAAEERFLEEGYEGAMVRSVDGPYKFGRSTVREGYLLKMKRFEDGEARILRVVELQHNHNEQTRDELGRSKRTTHKAGKVQGGTLGTLEVEDIKTGVQFGIGSGFSAAERAELWARRESLPGLLAKYRFFPTGSKEAPRFPTWLGIRDERDL